MNSYEEMLKGFTEVINKNNGEMLYGNTPDFILAAYIMSCLSAFKDAVKARNSWYTGVPIVENVEEIKDHIERIM